jgi:hypothetical protein
MNYRYLLSFESHTVVSTFERISDTLQILIEDRGRRSRWSDACCSETPTDQYIIYNTKIVVRKLASSWENDSAVRDLEFVHPLPRTPKKTIHDLPKSPPHQDFLIINALTQLIPHLLKITFIVSSSLSYVIEWFISLMVLFVIRMVRLFNMKR